MNDLQSLFNFINFLEQFRQVNRIVLHRSKDTSENDVEHTYQLAMISWYLIQKENLDLDLNKVLQLALVHDLVEAYAGDTYIYADKEKIESKEHREEEALKKIKENFPEIQNITQSIEEYEKRESKESVFIYALDKLLPICNIYLDQGRTWKLEAVSLDRLKAAKSNKVTLDPTVNQYYQQLISILEDNQQLFNK